MSLIIVEETKWFKCNKHKDNEIFFTLNIEKEIGREDISGVPQFLNMKVHGYLYKNESTEIVQKLYCWQFNCSNGTCRFDSFIEIPREFQANGLGTYLFHTILHEAIKYFPAADFRCKVSPIQEHDIYLKIGKEHITIDNTILRNSLYEKANMEFQDSTTDFPNYYAKKIEDMHIREDFDYISELSLIDILKEMRELTKKSHSQEREISYLKNRVSKKYDEVFTIQKRYKSFRRVVYIFILLGFFIFDDISF